LSECPQYIKSGRSDKAATKVGAPEENANADALVGAGQLERPHDGSPGNGVVRLPWTSNAFGISDLAVVSARSRLRLIGLFGDPNAGKTSLLTMWYLLLQHRGRISDQRFAGSLTLQGWENLAHWLHWKPGQAPMFPPHTSAGQRRVPGMLHLAFRSRHDTLNDVLITDPPGEWFSHWSIDRDAPSAAGARWMARHVDAAALIIDCAALVGPTRGNGREHLRRLVWRVSDELHDRPVALVWAKADVAVDPAMKEGLRALFQERLQHHREFAISVPEASEMDAGARHAFMELLDWLIGVPRPQGVILRHMAMSPAMDPLFAFRAPAG